MIIYFKNSDIQDLSNINPLTAKQNIILEKPVAFLKISSAVKKATIKNFVLSYNPEYYTQNIYIKPFFYTVFSHYDVKFFQNSDLDLINNFWFCYNYFAKPKTPKGFVRLKKQLEICYPYCSNEIGIIEERFWLSNKNDVLTPPISNMKKLKDKEYKINIL